MKIENPLGFLEQGKKFEIGDSLMLRFKLQDIKSDVYGEINGLSGEIPLILKYGELRMNSFYDLSEQEQQKHIKHFMDYTKHLNEDLDDEALQNLVITTIICAISYNPHLVPGTADFDSAVKLGIAGYLADDIYDSEEYISGNFDFGTVLGKISHAIAQAQKGNMDEFERIPLIIPPSKDTISIFMDRYKASAGLKSDPEHKTGLYWVFSTVLDTMISQTIVFSKRTASNFPRTARIVIAGINKGIEGACELHAVELGIIVKTNIRENFLFKQMLDCLHIISAGTNDICGLLKDIKKNQLIDSSILSWVNVDEGRDLVFCFNDTLNNVKQSYKMIDTVMRLLGNCYPEDQGLKDYIHLIKGVLDGQLIAYFGFTYLNSRYERGCESYLCKASN